MRFAALAFLSVVATAPLAAAGEAVTFSGMIGKLPIIVELANGASGQYEAGRYSYMVKGADIPLHASANGKGSVTLEEEKPCTPKLCKKADDSQVDEAPIGATWSLKADAAGGLAGTWKDAESGKVLPIKLERKGSRILRDSDDLFDAMDPGYYPSGHPEPPIFTEKDLPYDFLKVSRPLKEGPVTNAGQLSYRMDEDSRVGLAYPTVVSLGGEDIGPINTYLAQQRLQFEIPAFTCLSRAYLGFAWSGFDGEGTSGFDGGGQVTVEHLSSRLIGISESGSFYCGGAHPDNFTDHRLADARTGQALVPEKLLKGWVAKDDSGNIIDPATAAKDAIITWGPDDELAAYVNSHRDKMDADSEQDCGYDDLVKQNLAVYFTQDSLVFTLQGLPHVIFACTYDMLSVPLKDARPLLTDAGAKYFAELDN